MLHPPISSKVSGTFLDLKKYVLGLGPYSIAIFITLVTRYVSMTIAESEGVNQGVRLSNLSKEVPLWEHFGKS